MTHEKNFLVHYSQLLNFYAVDTAANIETKKLLFLELNQREMRADKYIYLKYSMLNDCV